LFEGSLKCCFCYFGEHKNLWDFVVGLSRIFCQNDGHLRLPSTDLQIEKNWEKSRCIFQKTPLNNPWKNPYINQPYKSVSES
jgi:hypothetical protein